MVHAWGRNTASWASRCSFPPRPVAKHNARYILVCLSLQYSRILTNETVSASLEVIRRARRSFRPREGAPPPGEGRSSGLKQSRRGQERAAQLKLLKLPRDRSSPRLLRPLRAQVLRLTLSALFYHPLPGERREGRPLEGLKRPVSGNGRS